MPKGQKFVDWTNPDNDKKLLHSIIAATDVSVNYEKVAQYFGGGVPASSIALRMTKLRKEAREKGLMEQSPSEPAVATKKGGRKTASGKQKSAKGGTSETQVESDESETGVHVKMEGGFSDDEDTKIAMKKGVKKSTKADDEKVIAGRVSKPRAKKTTPRKKSAKATDLANDSIHHNEDTQGMTPESMASEIGHSDMKNVEVETVEV
ncbi:MAG: hypothetical protein Q9212_007298 [Teloschistes hypoglaucus]